MRHLRRPLLVAVLFLALGTFLAWLAEGAPAVAPRPEPEFPRSLRQPEYERLRARRTLHLSGPAATAPALRAQPPRAVDPFLAALPRDPTEAVLVLEANALRHSRVGELFVDCVLRREGSRNPFDEIRREAGIDPLKDVDRVAVSTRGIVASGFFDGARLDRLEAESRVTSRGADGRVFAPARAGDEGVALGSWRRELLVLGELPFVEETLDRLGGGAAPESEAVLPEHLTYGEAYGVVPGTALRGLFRLDQEDLGRRLAELASRIELHADAMRDVAVVAHVTGEDRERLDDLGRAFGAALSIGRIQAAARGDTKLAELLEHARVARWGSGFSVELALPIDVVERWFEGCGDRASASAPTNTAAPAPPR